MLRTSEQSTLGERASRKSLSLLFETKLTFIYSTVTVTVTVDPDEPATLTKRGVEYRAATEAPTAVPAYASSCQSAGKYSSACSCWGITAVVTTAPVPTKTATVTVTADYCEDL